MSVCWQKRKKKIALTLLALLVQKYNCWCKSTITDAAGTRHSLLTKAQEQNRLVYQIPETAVGKVLCVLALLVLKNFLY